MVGPSRRFEGNDTWGGGSGAGGRADHGEDGIKCFALHPGGAATDLARNLPEETHAYLADAPDLAACFAVWLCYGQAGWARGRYLSATWDVGEIEAMKEEILREDLLVNWLRAKG